MDLQGIGVDAGEAVSWPEEASTVGASRPA
jgi:hypothetical protein